MSMSVYFMESGWFYLENDNRIGPVDRSEIERLISQNAVVWQTLVWRAGMDGWEKAGHHFTFSGGVGGPPPVPPRVPTAGVAMPASASTLRGEDNSTSAGGLYIGAPARGFGEAISVCLNGYATFSGRASRSEYWYFVLFQVFVVLASVAVDKSILRFEFERSFPYPFSTLICLALFVPSLATNVRRLHDTNRSGWWTGWFYIWEMGYSGLSIAILAIYANSLAPEELVAYAWVIGILGLVPLIYLLVLLVFTCQRGNPSTNRFG